MSFGKATLLQIFLLLVVLGGCLYLTRPESLRIRWNDETLYYTVARNIYQEWNFNSHHYLVESLLRKGYPTKDTHPPGYPMIVSLGFLAGGVSEATPFWVNYFLLGLTVFLIYLFAKKSGNTWGGIMASGLFLLYPLTLPMAHSIMSETSAAFIVMLVIAILFLIPEGVVKGILLAFGIALAYLIKPFLIAFLTTTILYIIFWGKASRGRTLVGLGVAFALLFFFVLTPLFSNREFYPYVGTQIFSQPTWGGKILRAWQNFKVNGRQFLSQPWSQGQGRTTLAMILLWGGSLLPGVALFFQRRKASADTYPRSRLGPLLFVTGLTFLQVALAVFLFYEYHAWRGTRALACFAPLLSLLAVMGASQWIQLLSGTKVPWKLALASVLGIGFLIFEIKSMNVAMLELRQSQVRQASYLFGTSARLKKVVDHYRLQPKRVASHYNYYFPIEAYPVEVIMSLGNKTLKDLKGIESKLALDLIELNETDPLYRENQKVFGTTQSLAERYRLLHREAPYHYYVP